MSADDAKDERSPGVHLLSKSDDEKMTAEDCGLWFYIRCWETHSLGSGVFWFDRHGFAISKDAVRQLARLA